MGVGTVRTRAAPRARTFTITCVYADVTFAFAAMRTGSGIVAAGAEYFSTSADLPAAAAPLKGTVNVHCCGLRTPHSIDRAAAGGPRVKLRRATTADARDRRQHDAGRG